MYDFGKALDFMKAGIVMRRKGWSGDGQFIFLQPGYPDGVPANENTKKAIGNRLKTPTVVINPHIMIRLPDGSLASYTSTNQDILAEDWEFA